MKPRHTCGAAAVLCVFFALAPSLCAQAAPAPRHTGVPQDWSQHTIVFSRDALARHPDIMYREPRVLHEMMQRWQPPNWGDFQGVNIPPNGRRESGTQRDWNMPLGAGRLSPHMYPAKFSFDPGAAPDCTGDYVVYGLATADTPATAGGQANLIGLNNLYVNAAGTGACAGSSPDVLFAYNITTVAGGRIATSPILSLDGTKIGFVESVPANAGMGTPAQAIFHVLTWTAGQGTSVTHAVVPTSMTSVTFSPSANCTTSSPWIDYGSDTVYVGDDDGHMYQITDVFTGTPTVSGGPWPVTLSLGNHLAPPVFDSPMGMLLVGSQNGNLYGVNVNAAPPTMTTLPVGTGPSSSIVAPAVVDITNDTTFVVSANNGSTGAVLVQANIASLGTIPPMAIAQIGLGSAGGTALHLYQPALSFDYYNDPSTGVITLCGTGLADTTPWQYTFGFTGITMNTSPIGASTRQLSTSATDRCTGWSEFFNPNAGPSDAITATSVAADVLTVTASNSDLTVGDEVYIQGTLESYLNGQTVTVTSLLGAGPTYTGFTANFSAAPYSNPTDTGAVSAIDVITAISIAANVLTVTAINSNLKVGEEVYIQGTAENILNGQLVTITSLIGSSPLYTGFTANFTYPNYSNPSDTGTASAGTDFFFFGLSADCSTILGGATNGCVVAIANYDGHTTTTTAAVAGGPSGIVVDNYSTAIAASSIYFVAEGADTAYKFTQEGLQ